MSNHPQLSIRYHWSAGSLPPPGYYEYSIEVHALQGVMIFLPDYPQHNPPRWLETFACRASALENLYEIIQNYREPQRGWGVNTPISIGGANQWLEITLPEGTFELTTQTDDRLQPAWDAIRALVPPEAWQRVYARRAAYIAEEHFH